MTFKALGTEKVNLVGFSYGTHLGLACIRYHGENLNRVVLVGTEGPDHTNKLPFTSDASLKRLAHQHRCSNVIHQWHARQQHTTVSS